MNRLLKSIIPVLVLASSAYAGDIKPFEGQRPIAVMIETDPWLMVIGSDTPSFALYEDGRVIFLKTVKGLPPRYMSKILSADELKSYKAKLAPSIGSIEIKRHFDLAPGITDQSETKIYLDIDGKQLITSIYGPIRQEAKTPFTSGSGKEVKPDRLPAELVALQSLMADSKFDQDEEWVPKYVEVMIWGFDYAKEPPILWPKDWPGLSASSSFKRGESYSIFLPGSERTKLKNLLRTMTERTPILIEGKKWAITFRYTFPSEPVWSKAFRERE